MIKRNLKVGSVIKIGDITIRLDHKSGQRVSLVIDAPLEVQIHQVKDEHKRTTSD